MSSTTSTSRAVRFVLEAAAIFLARSVSNRAAAGELASSALDAAIDTPNGTPSYTYEPSTSAYAGLRSTGRIDLLSDAELKRAIVHYFEDRQPAILRINENWTVAVRRWLDALASHVSLGVQAPTRTSDSPKGRRPDGGW